MTPYRPNFWQWVMIVIICLVVAFLISSCAHLPTYRVSTEGLGDTIWCTDEVLKCYPYLKRDDYQPHILGGWWDAEDGHVQLHIDWQGEKIYYGLAWDRYGGLWCEPREEDIMFGVQEVSYQELLRDYGKR